MELVLDTADLDAIKDLDQLLNVAGVTTNPSIIAKSGKQPEEVINGLVEYLRPNQTLFVQTVQTSYEGILEEARAICALRDKNTYVKIPCTHNGLRAIKAAKAEGLNVLATAIYSADVAFMAALNGADYLAPYVNRMCNYGDGIKTTCDLLQMLHAQGLSSKVMAASFHNVLEVHELVKAGIDAVTLPPDVLWSMIDNPSTDVAVREFTDIWEGAYGRRTLEA